MRRRYAWGVTGLLAVMSCGGDSGGVPWGDYDPSVRERIDLLARAKECDALQAEFDQADANNAATMSRTGHNNAELMGYIDDKMRDADCF